MAKETKSQNAILTVRGHNIKYLPYVFTEEGVLQLTGILHSTVADLCLLKDGG